MHSSHLRSGELFSTFLRTDYLHKLFGILLPKRFVCSTPLIYLFNSFIYISMNSCVFISTLGYNPIDFIYYLVQIVQALASGSLLSWFLCPFDMPVIVDFFFFF